MREQIQADLSRVRRVGPLCAVLGVPVPDAPFPRSHYRDGFWAHFGGAPV
ncbi:sulfotransferase [Roseovarius tibetensis]